MSVNQVDVDITDDQLRTDKTRLIMTNRVTIPPHHIAVFYSKPTMDVYIDPNTICSIRQNDLLTLEYPEILVLETLHSFDPMNMSNKRVIFAYNCSDLDLIIPRKHDGDVHEGVRIPHDRSVSSYHNATYKTKLHKHHTNTTITGVRFKQ